MTREKWFETRFKYLKLLALLFFTGLAFLLLTWITGVSQLIYGAMLMFPISVWFYILPLLHWKDRYQGNNSTLWGILILIEVTAWFKLVYWLRHIIPDWRKHGRYKDIG